jgi:hypothetical protein
MALCDWGASGRGADGRAPQRSPDRGLADVVVPSQLCHRLAGGIALGKPLLLAGVQDSRTAELRTLALRTVNAGLAALPDQLALELGNSARSPVRASILPDLH